jgi:hypothetical protein
LRWPATVGDDGEDATVFLCIAADGWYAWRIVAERVFAAGARGCVAKVAESSDSR